MVVKHKHGKNSHRSDCTLGPNIDWKKVENSNSKRLNFKISQGSMPPHPLGD